jgi:hypothetical protein
MKTIYDIINETKDTDKVYLVTGDDNTIHSAWVDKAGAEAEKKRSNEEIGSDWFSVKTEDKEKVIKED